MNKCVILLLFLSIFLYADEEVEEIFETYKDSIVYVQQTLYFQSSNVKHLEHFDRLEEHYKMKILDTYFTIASGSGFFITNEGHIITNQHVIDISNLDKDREYILWGLIENISRDLPEDMFSGKEFRQIIDDFEVLFKKSEFHFRLTVKNKEQYAFEIVKSDKELDIAVIKIQDDEVFTAIPLGNSDRLKVGKSVIALGYPLQSIFDLFLKFKELKSTLTTGNIAALRNEIWGIQHTATINFGNSGGPLINLEGEVIGVNVAKLGSTIFFAIPAKKVYEWFEDTGQGNLVALNENTSIEYIPDIDPATDAKRSVLETGKSLFIKLEKPYEVYINDELKGTTPLLITDLEPGEGFLRIESGDEYHGIQLKVFEERTDIITYTPEIGKYTGNLFVESTPVGAKVLIDGKNLGKTPAALSDITAEKHTLKLLLNGYQDYEEEIVIKKKDTIRISVELVKVYQITFQDPLPENTGIKVYNEQDEYTFSDKDKIWVAAGKWTIVLTSKLFKETSFTYDIADEKKISFTPEYYRSCILFKNLMPESMVFLNDIDITAKLQNAACETYVGEYDIRIKTEKYKDYREKIELEKDKDASVTIIYELSLLFTAKKNAWIGYPVLGAGVLCLVTGLFLNDEFIAQNLTDTYRDYIVLKWTSFSLAWGGLAVAVTGSVFVFKSIRQFTRAKTETEVWKDVAFSVDVRNNTPVLVIHFILKE